MQYREAAAVVNCTIVRIRHVNGPTGRVPISKLTWELTPVILCFLSFFSKAKRMDDVMIHIIFCCYKRWTPIRMHLAELR
jgi:hypothetical protein